MSMSRNMRRLSKKAQEKGQEVPIANYHLANKKLRRYGVGVHYDTKAGIPIIANWNDYNG